jgi:GAF domain-containing protein
MGSKPVLDEASFERLLEAAYVVQQHNAQQRAISNVSTPDPKADFNDILAEIVETQTLIQLQQLDFKSTMRLVAERAESITGASGALIGVLEKEHLAYVVGTGTLERVAGHSEPVDMALSADCLKRCKPVESHDLATDDRFPSEAGGRAEARAVLAVPILREGRVGGCLELHFDHTNSFSRHEVRTCQLLAGLITEAISRAAEQERKQAPEAERAPVLEALAKLQPQLERLATQNIQAVQAIQSPPVPQPAAASVSPDPEPTHEPDLSSAASSLKKQEPAEPRPVIGVEASELRVQHNDAPVAAAPSETVPAMETLEPKNVSAPVTEPAPIAVTCEVKPGPSLAVLKNEETVEASAKLPVSKPMVETVPPSSIPFPSQSRWASAWKKEPTPPAKIIDSPSITKSAPGSTQPRQAAPSTPPLVPAPSYSMPTNSVDEVREAQGDVGETTLVAPGTKPLPAEHTPPPPPRPHAAQQVDTPVQRSEPTPDLDSRPSIQPPPANLNRRPPMVRPMAEPATSNNNPPSITKGPAPSPVQIAPAAVRPQPVAAEAPRTVSTGSAAIDETEKLRRVFGTRGTEPAPPRNWPRIRANVYLAISVLLFAFVLFSWLMHRPSSAPALSHSADAEGNSTAQVWVDVTTARYFCAGEDQFGRTAGGKLMTQEQARQTHYAPASHSCE